jgi:hypothetical protein
MSNKPWLAPLKRKLMEVLLSAQGSEGGFGYLREQASATEPTTLALMALSCFGEGAARESAHRARRWLAANQLPSGGWPTRPPDTEESWVGALALLALAGDKESYDARQRGLHWLVSASGRPVKIDSTVFAIDGKLRGWPWAPDNFSWVEPTSYALMALKMLSEEAGPGARSRVTEGEALLFDRVVDKGGWNYGNRRVYGKSYEPYPETTAVALIALKEYPDRSDVQRSIGSLRQAISQKHASGLQVGWGILCLGIFGLLPDGLYHRLEEIYERTGFLGRIPTLAVAILALSGTAGVEFFRGGVPR